MENIFSGPLPGGGYVIACGRRERKKCATCKAEEEGEMTMQTLVIEVNGALDYAGYNVLFMESIERDVELRCKHHPEYGA